ncbi:MAG TPA: TRIC cation channel family protein [Candidatus Scatomorpha merdigallinarum]|nr:TRIC cation channel family protein [Candidatus Scatomorpha merdigallinarum]
MDLETVLFVLEIVGTLAFAVSGAFVGVRRDMDVFGVIILGLTTAVGGGVIRDLILGLTPPRTFQHPIYAMIAIAASVAVFLIARRGFTEKTTGPYSVVMLIMDSLGLGAFTVSAIGTALEQGVEYNAFLLVFTGVVTGVGGGVLRDVMAGQTPYIFLKHVYASASLLGAVLCVIMMPLTGDAWAIALGMTATVVIRLLSAYFRWNLPHAGINGSKEEKR